MAYNSNILLGRITRVSGHEGAVTVKLEKIFSENIPHMESVFLEIEGKLVPFFISDSEYSGADILRLKFDGYNSIEKIKEFTGCRVFLTSGIPSDNQADDIQSLAGCKVFIEDDKLLGTITEVIQTPGQYLLNILSADNKDILIPFHEHFIISFDRKKNILIMSIPEGLTEIN